MQIFAFLGQSCRTRRFSVSRKFKVFACFSCVCC